MKSGFGQWMYFARGHITRQGMVASAGCWLVACGFMALIVGVLFSGREWTRGQIDWVCGWPLYEIVALGVSVALGAIVEKDHVPAVVKLIGWLIPGFPFLFVVVMSPGGAVWLGVFLATRIFNVLRHRPTEKDQVGRGLQFFVALIPLAVAFILLMDIDANRLKLFAGGVLPAGLRVEIAALSAVGALHFFLTGLLEVLLDPLWALPDLADRRADPAWWTRRS